MNIDYVNTDDTKNIQKLRNNNIFNRMIVPTNALGYAETSNQNENYEKEVLSTSLDKINSKKLAELICSINKNYILKAQLEEIDYNISLKNWQIDKIFTMYDVQNKGLVRNYLLNHSILIEKLLEAHSVLEKLFYSNVTVRIEFSQSGDSEEQRTLFGNIDADELPQKEQLDRLFLFDKEWYLHQVSEIGGILNFNLG